MVVAGKIYGNSCKFKEYKDGSRRSVFYIRDGVAEIGWPTEISFRKFAEAAQPIIAENQLLKDRNGRAKIHHAFYTDMGGMKDEFNFPASDLSQLPSDGRIRMMKITMPNWTVIEYDNSGSNPVYQTKTINIATPFDEPELVADFLLATTSKKADRQFVVDRLRKNLLGTFPKQLKEEGEMYGLVTSDTWQHEFSVDAIGPKGIEMYRIAEGFVMPYMTRPIQQFDFVRIFAEECDDGSVQHMVQWIHDYNIGADELAELGKMEIGERLRASIKPWGMGGNRNYFEWTKETFQKRLAFLEELERRTPKEKGE